MKGPLLPTLVLSAILISNGYAWAGADDTVVSGDKAFLKVRMLGCRELEDSKRLHQLIEEHDDRAAIEFVRDKHPACGEFSKGTTGIVQDMTDWHELRCFRPIGNPYCYWFGFYVLDLMQEK